MFGLGDVCKFLSSNNEFYLNQDSKTHTLLTGVSKLLIVRSTFIVDWDEIWSKRAECNTVGNL
jgi:hypothetical protein